MRAAAAAVLLILALAGCGSGGGSDEQSGTEVGPTATAESGGSDTTVTSVTLQRSGGKTGDTVRRTFVAGEPAPEGFTDAQVDDVIDLARTFIRTDSTKQELPENTCCDRYVYRVVIGFSDGSASTFTTVDGAKTTPAFRDLLSELS